MFSDPQLFAFSCERDLTVISPGVLLQTVHNPSGDFGLP